VIFDENRLRNRLPPKKVNFNILILIWNPRATIYFSNLLEFQTPRFAYIYRIHTVSNKKFLPRSIFKNFVEMEMYTTLFNIFVLNTKEIMIVRNDDFKFMQTDPFLLYLLY